jgi:uncharacterized protein YuzE
MKEIEKLAIKVFSVIKPNSDILTDYDGKEDVLYINYLNSGLQMADFGRRFGDYIIRLKNGLIIGVTILNASEHYRKRFEDKPSILVKPITLVFA